MSFSRRTRVPAALPTAHRHKQHGPVPEQRCFPWEAPDLPGLPPSPSRDRLTLTADVSESASETTLCLKRLGADVHIRPIRCSYALGQVGIQKRTMEQMKNSAADDTLRFHSLFTAQRFSHKILILECCGEWSGHIWQKTVKACLKGSIPVLVTTDAGETARLILWLGSAVTCRKRETSAVRGIHAAAPEAERLLQTLPGVGTAFAHQLWQRYGHGGIIAA